MPVDTRHHWREPLLREGLRRWIEATPKRRSARTIHTLKKAADMLVVSCASANKATQDLSLAMDRMIMHSSTFAELHKLPTP